MHIKKAFLCICIHEGFIKIRTVAAYLEFSNSLLAIVGGNIDIIIFFSLKFCLRLFSILKIKVILVGYYTINAIMLRLRREALTHFVISNLFSWIVTLVRFSPCQSKVLY